jgi:hypothetical protein|uniref:Uncharacterized protein n=1 Tax=Attheya septentrionalis TaxID=420275 RepID=A0A7S2UQA0_9STRA|mmetsp:Transcript_7964/g.14360  ORF Transcript_7964/g.14360 Transcript_7964/m.14360 type:complete len:134 (+) Transcript_7964:92-493(+)|eukprot:CAMPEP_0198283980 /NCGR_PEP_ID=MMETSP1449-20131203/3545_1 /TAXON_ID=420275 /ORGANISM="Attheya septentrionalis, Strain CCMP2084" /LENGTH=133 /DNA_ID=CAMNT_0043980885 /DNA_START=92 /DNA_END=493 /DNA_ORIENTATION=-
MRPTDLPLSPTVSKAVTPSFSADLKRLRESLPNGTVVDSYSEAKAAALKWDIVSCRGSPLRHRLPLQNDEEWATFFKSCRNSDGRIELETALRKCYDTAFAMPPSPSFSFRLSPANTNQPAANGAGIPSPLAI